MISILLTSLLFAHLNLPTKVEVKCSKTNPVDLVLIGETHFSSASKEIYSWVNEYLANSAKIFVENGFFDEAVESIDHPIARLYLQVSDLVRAYKEESDTYVTIQWINFLVELQKHARLLAKLSESERQNVYNLLVNMGNLGIEDKRRFHGLVKDRREVLINLSLNLLEYYNLITYNLLPRYIDFSILDTRNLETVSLSQIESNFKALDLPRETYMAQKLTDAACESSNQTFVVIVGAKHIDKVEEELNSTALFHVQSHDVSFTAFFAKRSLHKLLP